MEGAQDNMIHKNFNKIFQIIHSAYQFSDWDSFIKEILTNLSGCFQFDRSHILLQKEKNYAPTFYLNNMENMYSQQYLDYYRFKDPLGFITGPASNPHLSLGPLHENGVVSWQHFLSHESFISSEYYNDFLKPQKIFFEATAYLKFEDCLLGTIGLYRSRKSKAFCTKDLKKLRSLSSYIALGLKNIQIYNQFNMQNDIISILEDLSTSALILIDDDFSPIYMNPKAKKICQEYYDNRFVESNYHHSIPLAFLKECEALREEMKKNPRQVFSLPMRNVTHNKSNDFAICSQIIDNTFQSSVKKVFLIRIDQIKDCSRLDLRRIRGLYNLTSREAEIVGYVVQGQKYSDIAQNLNISGLTVKTHIQNIFEKMNVNSRSAVIYKIMNEI